MAEKDPIAQRKQELVAQLADARKSLSASRAQLQEKLQVKRQLGKLISRKPKALFAGSLAAGLATTLLFRRSRKKAKSAPKTLSHMLLGWALSLLKPVVKAWLMARAKQYATQYAKQYAADRISLRTR